MAAYMVAKITVEDAGQYRWYDCDAYAAPKALHRRVSTGELVFLRGLPA